MPSEESAVARLVAELGLSEVRAQRLARDAADLVAFAREAGAELTYDQALACVRAAGEPSG